MHRRRLNKRIRNPSISIVVGEGFWVGLQEHVKYSGSNRALLTLEQTHTRLKYQHGRSDWVFVLQEYFEDSGHYREFQMFAQTHTRSKYQHGR